MKINYTNKMFLNKNWVVWWTSLRYCNEIPVEISL